LSLFAELEEPAAAEYLDQGVCRRLNVILHAIERVFSIFPPERTAVLERDELLDVQSYLHAFVINIYGVLDNLAWVFVLEKDILAAIGARTRVGLFTPATQAHLPKAVRDHLQSTAVSTWYSTYAKNYRDALAHRIPLYVPPWITTNAARQQALDREIQDHLQRQDWEHHDARQAEQDALHASAPVFLHSTTSADGMRPIYLHPQMIVDAIAVMGIATRLGREFREPP
jgi:hypothetical protein